MDSEMGREKLLGRNVVSRGTHVSRGSEVQSPESGLL